jgi:predicted transcriptional regulator of viral defense system
MHAENLQSLLDNSGGVLFAKDIAAAGVPNIYLTEFLKQGKLERIDHGVYIAPDALEDRMFVLQNRRSRIIYSHDTALFLHDLSDRDPLTYSVTVPTGYNTKNLSMYGLTVFSIKKELYEVGASTAQTSFSRSVRTYNIERTLCDMLRSRSRMDGALLPDALKRYVRRRDKNIPLLMQYAEIFRVEKPLRQYLEVLL